jgi:signal transduction histidine kinase
MRPLDRLPSIKAKLGVVIVAAVVVTAGVIAAGISLDVPLAVCALVAILLALAMVQLLARGMTSPLREMAAAAQAMARGEHGRRVTASSRDEVGELARAFNTMAAELAEVDRLRRDLVANVSHELRTPITGLQATLENLVDGVEQPDPETLASMHRQVERLGRLVAQLLDLSRLEAQADPLHREEFPIGELLAAASANGHRGAARVVVDVQPPSLTAYGDRERIHQVVANLVENAVRHSPAGADVLIRAHRDREGIAIEVLDEGPGIPPAEAERVFDRFYRLDAARSSEDGGTGLGLAIARWIVDLHGGRIHADRRDPHGCRMVVVLPGR